MKIVNMFLQRAADAAENSAAATTAAAVTAKVYTSEKLTAIKAAQKSKMAELQKEQDEDKQFELNTEIFKLTQDARAEIAALKAAEAAAENEAKRAAKVGELRKLVAMGAANTALQADKKVSDEDKAVSQLAYDTAFDAIANQLLGSVPRAASAPKSGVTGEKTGAQKEQIVEWYKAHRASGLDHTAALKAVTDVNGVARGSAWGPVDNYRKASGDKA